MLRGWWILVAIVIITLVAFSRVYLGVHFVGDVLGGVAIGLGLSMVGYAGFQAPFWEALVQRVKNKIESDLLIEAVRSLPTHTKLILLGIILQQEVSIVKLKTGEVYYTYSQLCRRAGLSPLTQRRVTDLISELDMLGLINAKVKSFGRGGRTKEIQSSVSAPDVKRILNHDDLLMELRSYRPKVQTTLI